MKVQARLRAAETACFVHIFLTSFSQVPSGDGAFQHTFIYLKYSILEKVHNGLDPEHRP
jgi:hypothetical protein